MAAPDAFYIGLESYKPHKTPCSPDTLRVLPAWSASRAWNMTSESS